MPRIALTLLAFSLMLAAPATAGAAVVTWTPPYSDPPGTDPESSCSRYMQCPPASLSVVDAKNERNDLTLEAVGRSEVLVRDAAAPLEAGGGCQAQPDGAVRCPTAPGISVNAGGGNDRVVSLFATVLGGEGDDELTGAGTLNGGPGADTLRGGEAGDTLIGGPGADTVDGLGGDDVVADDDGSVAAADRLDGGAGIDTIVFADRAVPVRVDLAAAPQQAGAGGEGNVVAGFESAKGGEGDDELTGPLGTFARVELEGGGGDDRIVNRADAGEVRLFGGAGDDTVTGAAVHDRIDGGDGDDVLDGGAGDDDVSGGAGADRIAGGDGDDTLAGFAGRDEIAGGAGNDGVDGGGSSDSLTGDAGDDGMSGGSGGDDVRGGAGLDRVFGGSGEDAVDGGGDADVVSGGSGRDLMKGGAGNDRLNARDRRNDDLDCGAGRDLAIADRRERAVGCERLRRSR